MITQSMTVTICYPYPMTVIDRITDKPSILAVINLLPLDVSMVGWLVVFNVPSTARSFRDGTPFTVPCEGREAR